MEACVLHGLKRRAAGFLRSNKLAALFMKVGKMFPPAEDLCRKVQELEQIIENKWETLQWCLNVELTWNVAHFNLRGQATYISRDYRPGICVREVNLFSVDFILSVFTWRLTLIQYDFYFYNIRQNQGQMSQESVRKQSGPPNLSPLAIKHLWIRTALTEKVLDKIVLYLVENSRWRSVSYFYIKHFKYSMF